MPFLFFCFLLLLTCRTDHACNRQDSWKDRRIGDATSRCDGWIDSTLFQSFIAHATNDNDNLSPLACATSRFVVVKSPSGAPPYLSSRDPLQRPSTALSDSRPLIEIFCSRCALLPATPGVAPPGESCLTGTEENCAEHSRTGRVSEYVFKQSRCGDQNSRQPRRIVS